MRGSEREYTAGGTSEREDRAETSRGFDGCKDMLLDGPQGGKINRDVQKRQAMPKYGYRGVCFAGWASGRDSNSRREGRIGWMQRLVVGWASEREKQQKCPDKAMDDQIRESGCVTRAHNLLKSLQEMGEKDKE